jgi:hypothetical protein
LAQAEIALRVRHGDKDATKLHDDAQAGLNRRQQELQNEATYKAAMEDGGGYLARGDYTNALAQAEIALRVRHGDKDATKLHGDAQAGLNQRQQELQNEAAYKAAMQDGGGYLARGDYTNALAQAEIALKLRRGEKDATKLHDDAQAGLNRRQQELQNEAAYKAAMKDGGGYLARGDYTNALAQAEIALKLRRGEKDATKLHDDAQAGLNRRQQEVPNNAEYLAAMKNGHESFEHRDYSGALALANKALSIKSGDAEAMKLREAAQKKLKRRTISSEMEDDYQTNMKNGLAALARGDYAEAAARADEALTIKPDDEESTKLRDAAHYQLAMKKGTELLARGDTDATKLPLARAQFKEALISKPLDPDATRYINAIHEKIDQAFSVAFDTGRQAALNGKEEEAQYQLEKMRKLKPEDSHVGELALVIKKMAGPLPPPQRHQPTNFSGVFGHSIPELDFIWVEGIGPSGAYVSVNELPWEQYQALGGGSANPDPNPHRPAGFLALDRAKTFVDLLNGNPAYKNIKFRLPSLDEYKTLSDVTDFALIPDLVNADTNAGERFKGSMLKPREIVAAVTTNKSGLRNVIGNVREWTTDGQPFGIYYIWGKSGIHQVTEAPTDTEPIGLRLIAEPKD